MTDEIINIRIRSNDIFDYVVRNTNYCPIERCIDPTIFEVFDEGIYNHREKKLIAQDEDFIQYHKHLTNLKSLAKDMSTAEIIKIANEIEEIAPKTIKL